MATVRQFTITTAAVVNDTITVAHGGGATPVAVLLWSQMRQTAADGTERPADAVGGFGFAVSTSSRRSVSYVCADGTVLAAQSIRNDALLVLPYNDLNTYGRLDLSALDATNATFIVDEQWFSQTRVIALFLFAGDTDEAVVADFTEPAATGTQDITGLAGGAATMAVLIGCDTTAALNTVQASFAIMFGLCAGAGGEGVWLGGIEDGVSSTQRAYCRGGESVAMYNRTTQAFEATAVFDSFISGGVRLNWTTRTQTGRRYCALLLRGAAHEVNEFVTSVTGAANVTISGLPDAADGGLILSANRAESTAATLTNDFECSAGAFESTTVRAVQTARSPNGTGVAQAGQESDEVYLNLDGAGAPSVQGAADIDVIGATSIELDMSTGDNAANFGLAWTLHDSAVDTTPDSTETGTLTDAISGIALSAQTEAGTGTDAVGGVALSAQTEAGTSTDAVTGIALPTTEPGTFAEVVAIALASAESGTFSEATELDTGETTTPSDSDTGTLAELATVAVTLSQAETGTLLETIVGIALASSDEFGQEELVEGTEPITAVEGQTIALSTQADTLTLAEAVALALAGTETGTAAEQATLAVSFSLTEAVTFTESSILQQGESNPVDEDSASFGEAASIAVTLVATESLTFGEAPTIVATMISAETAALIESGALLNFTGIAGGTLSVGPRGLGTLGVTG